MFTGFTNNFEDYTKQDAQDEMEAYLDYLDDIEKSEIKEGES